MAIENIVREIDTILDSYKVYDAKGLIKICSEVYLQNNGVKDVMFDIIKRKSLEQLVLTPTESSSN